MSAQSLKSKTIKGVTWKFVNTLASLSISFVLGIILARKLLPEDFGAVAMVGVFTSVLSIFTDGGLTTALIQKEKRTEEDKSTIFYYNFIACYFIYSIIYFIAPYIADFYGIPILCKLARVSTLGMLITPFASMQAIHFTINLDFKTPAYIGLICCIINASIAIWMVYNGYGVWSLAVPGIFSTTIQVFLEIAVVRWRPTKSFSIASFKELFGFSSKLLITYIIEKIYSNITPLVVGKFFSPAQLGLYEKARGWPTIPSQTFTEVLQGVTFPVMSKMQNDIPRLRDSYRRMMKLYAFLVFPMMVGLAIVAKPLTIVLTTEKWIDSVPLMQLICFSFMCYPVHALNNNIIISTGHSSYFLKLEIITKFVAFAAMVCSLPFGLVAFCTANIFSAWLNLSLTTYYTKKIIGWGIVDIMKDLFPIICNCIIMGIICLFMQSVVDTYIIQLLICIPTAIVYYIISARFLNKEQFNEVIEILATKLPKLNKYHAK